MQSQTKDLKNSDELLKQNTKCYAYLRVSSIGQIEGDGLTRQRIAVENYAKANGYVLLHIYEEQGVSGKTDLENRPALARMLEDMVCGDVQTVLVEKLDRVARDLMIQEAIIADIQKRGLQIVSAMEPDLCSNDPSRKLVRQIMGAVAEYDRAMIVAKTRAARERIRASGKKCEGRKAYGTRDGERETVSRILELHASGMNYSTIAAELNEAGITTRSGGIWYPQQVSNVVRRCAC